MRIGSTRLSVFRLFWLAFHALCFVPERSSQLFWPRLLHTVRHGVCPSSAVFPLPTPWIGIFEKQGTPKLNRKKWKQLCFKRCLHICVMALNYVHNNLRPVPLALLGRRPNLAQRDVYVLATHLVKENAGGVHFLENLFFSRVSHPAVLSAAVLTPGSGQGQGPKDQSLDSTGFKK